MMQVGEAVQKAQAYVPKIFASANGNDLVLEGVELTDDSQFWTITFSYAPPGGPLRNLREYKTIKLRAQDGEFFGARNGLL